MSNKISNYGKQEDTNFFFFDFGGNENPAELSYGQRKKEKKDKKARIRYSVYDEINHKGRTKNIYKENYNTHTNLNTIIHKKNKKQKFDEKDRSNLESVDVLKNKYREKQTIVELENSVQEPRSTNNISCLNKNVQKPKNKGNTKGIRIMPEIKNKHEVFINSSADNSLLHKKKKKKRKWKYENLTGSNPDETSVMPAERRYMVNTFENTCEMNVPNFPFQKKNKQKKQNRKINYKNQASCDLSSYKDYGNLNSESNYEQLKNQREEYLHSLNYEKNSQKSKMKNVKNIDQMSNLLRQKEKSSNNGKIANKTIPEDNIEMSKKRKNKKKTAKRNYEETLTHLEDKEDNELEVETLCNTSFVKRGKKKRNSGEIGTKGNFFQANNLCTVATQTYISHEKLDENKREDEAVVTRINKHDPTTNKSKKRRKYQENVTSLQQIHQTLQQEECEDNVQIWDLKNKDSEIEPVAKKRKIKKKQKYEDTNRTSSNYVQYIEKDENEKIYEINSLKLNKDDKYISNETNKSSNSFNKIVKKINYGNINKDHDLFKPHDVENYYSDGAEVVIPTNRKKSINTYLYNQHQIKPKQKSNKAQTKSNEKCVANENKRTPVFSTTFNYKDNNDDNKPTDDCYSVDTIKTEINGNDNMFKQDEYIENDDSNIDIQIRDLAHQNVSRNKYKKMKSDEKINMCEQTNIDTNSFHKRKKKKKPKYKDEIIDCIPNVNQVDDEYIAGSNEKSSVNRKVQKRKNERNCREKTCDNLNLLKHHKVDDDNSDSSEIIISPKKRAQPTVNGNEVNDKNHHMKPKENKSYSEKCEVKKNKRILDIHDNKPTDSFSIEAETVKIEINENDYNTLKWEEIEINENDYNTLKQEEIEINENDYYTLKREEKNVSNKETNIEISNGCDELTKAESNSFHKRKKKKQKLNEDDKYVSNTNNNTYEKNFVDSLVKEVRKEKNRRTDGHESINENLNLIKRCKVENDYSDNSDLPIPIEGCVKEENLSNEKKSPTSKFSLFLDSKDMYENNTNNTNDDSFSIEVSEVLNREINEDDIEKIMNLEVKLPFTVPPLHEIQTRPTGLTKEQSNNVKKQGIEIKSGFFTAREDETILHNWKEFCKEHDLLIHPSLLFSFPGKMPMQQKTNFLRYLAHGLENRVLHRVHHRFKIIFQKNIKIGRFTLEEDETILKFMRKTSSKRPYIDLAKILNRSNYSIEKRYDLLKRTQNNTIKWTIEMVNKFVKYMKKVTKCESLEQLKHRKITPEEWRKLSVKLDIPPKKLRTGWNLTIYPRLFSNESDMKSIKKKIIDRLYETKETDWKCINWTEIAKDFDGFTPQKIYMMFKHLVNFIVPETKRKNLKECLNFLKNIYMEQRDLPSTHRFKKFICEGNHLVHRDYHSNS